MKLSRIILALSLSVSALALAGFTQAGLEIRGIDIYSVPVNGTETEPLVRHQDNETVASSASVSKDAQPQREKPQPLGPTYLIAEPDLLEVFMDRISKLKSSGEYQKRFNQEKQKISDRLSNPPAVDGLVKARETRLWLLEASIPEKLPESLLRQAAQVELPKLTRELIFIDGIEEEELQAAKTIVSHRPEARIVLVGGSAADVSKKLGRRIFFDQGGALTRTFGIQATPAVLFNGTDGPSGIEFTPNEVHSVLPHFL